MRFRVVAKDILMPKIFFLNSSSSSDDFQIIMYLLKNAINFNCDHGLAVSKVTCYTGSPGSNPGAVAFPLMFDMERMNL